MTTPVQDGSDEWYVRNCTISPRPGDEALFTVRGGVIFPRLDGYAIIPIEDYVPRSVSERDTAHTDHPLRHYDRTCPACNEPPAHITAPEGWKLVPVEPTPAMLNQGIHAFNETLGTPYTRLDAEWAAMLAAAPQPPVEGGYR